MQSLESQKTLEKEKKCENSDGFPCHSSTSPAKANNVEASNPSTADKKPTYLIIKKVIVFSLFVLRKVLTV